MKFRTLALTAVTAGALGIAGCGGDDSSSTGSSGGGGGKDANTLLVNTFQPSGDSSKIKSGTIDIEIEGELSGGAINASGKASAVIKLNEAKDGAIPEFSAAVKVKGEQKGGGKVDLDAGGTYTDNRFYVSYDGDNYDVGEELSKRAVDSLKAAISQTNSSSTEQQDMIGKLGLEPQTWLTNPKVDGEEKVGDVDAYKISGEVNVKALVPDILDAAKKAQSLAGSAGSVAKVPEVTDAQLDAAAKQIKTLDVAIWTGKDDNILRKLEVDLEIEGTKGDKVGGTVSLTLTDVNEQQDIKAPSDTKPITDLMPKLGGLFQAAAGVGSSGAGTVSQQYLDCMNAAGGDAAKLNACQASAAK
jgi:hypothetical protein